MSIPMKELLKTIAVSILTLASTIACSQENIRASNDTKRGAVANLCDADEESIFTCFTEKKIASLCLRQQERQRLYKVQIRLTRENRINLSNFSSGLQ